MRAEDYLQSGDLGQALATLTEEIRSKPDKAELRIFMFQLLGVLGQWERAMTQLNVAAEMDSDALLLAQVYRLALNCEVLRSEIFQGKRSPLIFGEPLEWTAWLAQVLPLMAAGELEAAAVLRDRAFEAAPAVSGQIDGQPFAWIADADTRLGPILEAIINGKYYWIPFQRIQGIQIEKTGSSAGCCVGYGNLHLDQPGTGSGVYTQPVQWFGVGKREQLADGTQNRMEGCRQRVLHGGWATYADIGPGRLCAPGNPRDSPRPAGLPGGRGAPG
jgi:hypothetical protein